MTASFSPDRHHPAQPALRRFAYNGRGGQTRVTPLQRLGALDAAKRASARSARAVHVEMKRGLNSLASIAFSAPLVGVVGTLWGILSSFHGIAGERWSDYADIMDGLAQSLVPAALGLLVALLAFCGHKYLLSRLEDFDLQMENASLQLLNQLASAKF